MSGDFARERSPMNSRSRSRSPRRASPSNNDQQSQRNQNRMPPRHSHGSHYDDRRNNRYRSNNSHGKDYRNSNSGRDRLDDNVNLYSDRELGLKYRWEKTVHVSNIPYEMRWGALKDLFRAEIGDVMYTEVFERDGKSLGCGSVEFRNVEDAKRAVEKMHQFEYGGRKLNVKLDEEGFRTRRAKFQSLEGRLQEKGNTISSHQDTVHNQYGNTNIPPNVNISRSHQVAGLNSVGNSLSGYSSVSGIPSHLLQRLGIDGPVTNKIFVANLDFKCDEKKIRDVFSLAGRVRDVVLKRNKDGQSRGMAVVEYEYPLEAVQAVSMFNERQLYDRIMAVKIDLKDESNDDGRSMKLPSGLKSIGAGLGVDGNPIRSNNVNKLDSGVPQMNSMNINPAQPLNNSVSDFMNHNEIAALQALSQLPPNAISALTQLAASGFSGLNSLSGVQNNNSNMNATSLNVDPYTAANSLYSSISGYSNYQQGTGHGSLGSLSSQVLGPFYKDDDARLGQASSLSVSGRSQSTSSFSGGRGLLGNGVSVGGLGSPLGSYSTQSTNAPRSVGGGLGGAGMTGTNSSIYDRPLYR